MSDQESINFVALLQSLSIKRESLTKQGLQIWEQRRKWILISRRLSDLFWTVDESCIADWSSNWTKDFIHFIKGMWRPRESICQQDSLIFELYRLICKGELLIGYICESWNTWTKKSHMRAFQGIKKDVPGSRPNTMCQGLLEEDNHRYWKFLSDIGNHQRRDTR